MKEINNIDAHPLAWPGHIPRTKRPKDSRFKSSRSSYDGRSKFVAAKEGVISELRRLGAKSIVISSNIPLRLDGQPRASFRTPEDIGIAVYFVLDGEMKVIACDAWNRITDNLHAIYLSIQALRGLDRWGCSDILRSAFAGFRALPESATPSSWRQVLGAGSGDDYNKVRDRYRTLVKRARGEELYAINAAWHSAKQELNR